MASKKEHQRKSKGAQKEKPRNKPSPIQPIFEPEINSLSIVELASASSPTETEGEAASIPAESSTPPAPQAPDETPVPPVEDSPDPADDAAPVDNPTSIPAEDSTPPTPQAPDETPVPPVEDFPDPADDAAPDDNPPSIPAEDSTPPAPQAPDETPVTPLVATVSDPAEPPFHPEETEIPASPYQEPPPSPKNPDPSPEGAGELEQATSYWEKTAPSRPGKPELAITPPPPPSAPVECQEPAPTVQENQGEYALPKEKRLYIVMITPEVAPCAKVGGLGDVVQGLGRELEKRGHKVEIIAPMYSCMRYETIEDLHEVYGELWCPHYNQWRSEKVFQGRVGGGLTANFITGGDYTQRPAIYGYNDDLQRFSYFCRQAMEFMFKTNRRPDIIHCHDWTTGLVPAILWDIYQPLGWNNSRVVYTIHNNECQGLCGFPDKLLGLVGLNHAQCHRPDRMQDDKNRSCINLMKAGIIYSNFTTTVSPSFASELKTVAGGRGLEQSINKNAARIGGILNGIDYETWNPQTDSKLAAVYSHGENFFEKYKNKTALREWLYLWDAWKPIVSVVTRLTHQKGIELIKRAIYSTLEEKSQFVLLGSAPDPKINNEFMRLQNEFKDNRDVNLYIGYHEDLSRLIYAGSDIFLVPSLFEPCGLTQMIALRYGTVPVVRETGGLKDTVFDLDNSAMGLGGANGFSFRDPTNASLDYGLKRAIRLWFDQPDIFNQLARNGMQCDYSWRHPAVHYENIYNYIRAE
ncbi:MAG: glycogen synthase GlgA [Planctomycetota bacterium]|jgi:starch synthase|nr:glycogen synthase GlgA [Planctomycetota bacterium]